MTYNKKVGIRAKIIFFARPKFKNFGTPTQMFFAKLIPK